MLHVMAEILPILSSSCIADKLVSQDSDRTNRLILSLYLWVTSVDSFRLFFK